MSLQTWWLFVVMAFFVSATPGPNMLLVMSHAARFGAGRAVMTMVGCMLSLLTMMGISAAGLGAVLHRFPLLFDALRYAGAAYLAYLGYRLWTSPAQGMHLARSESVPRRSGWALLREGMVVAASNPKAIVFAAAFFPQFIEATAPALPQFALLLATFTVIEVSWYGVYALSGHKLSRFLQRSQVLRTFNRITGGVFVGFATLMAASR